MNLERWQLIDRIFQAALELEPGQRLSYLDETCSGDPQMRSEVEALLSSDQRGNDLLEMNAFEATADLLTAEQQELAEGDKVGHYCVIGLLGAGGMGEVYLAEDTRLSRRIALKILPAGDARSESRLRRFQQEARSASALNHPNILTIHDIWEIDGRHLIATEYIEGESLRQRIAHGKLSTEEALDVSVQVASALAAAHQTGIIHRDIKPENIMIRRDGLIKVLDFGLAKLTEAPIPSENPDETADAFTNERKALGNGVNSESGLLIGTLPYMSPEQLKGERLDARTDIFSLGVVMHEMLTGRAPFRGENTADVVAAILKGDKDPLSKYAHEVPAGLERIVSKALRPNLGDHYQSMKEVLIDLRDLCKDLELISLEGRLAPVAHSRRRTPGLRGWSKRWRVVLGAALVLAPASGILWWIDRAPAEFRLETLARVAAYGGYTGDPTVSPDRKYMAFASNLAGEGHTDIWLQSSDPVEPIRVTSLPGDVSHLAFSPDGNRIAFMNEGGEHDGIYVVPTMGGEPRLFAARGVRPRWSPDGKWLAYWVGPDSLSYGPDSGCKIFLMPASGGDARQFHPEFLTASRQAWSPDGKHLIFMGLRDREQVNNDWWVAPVEGGEAIKTGTRDIFTRVGLSAPPDWWMPGNYILFTSIHGSDIENLWRISLDPSSWKTQDPPEQLTAGTTSVASVAPLPDWRIFFADWRQTVNLWSLPVEGENGKVTAEPQQITRDEALNEMPSLSVDGDTLVYRSPRAGRVALWYRDLKSGRESILNAEAMSYLPSVSPDGKFVVYGAVEGPGESASLYVMPLDGGGAEKLIGGARLAANGWLFTRNRLLFEADHDSLEGSPKVLLLDIKTKKTQMVLEHAEYKFSEIFASPDDRWISFVAIKEGHRNVFIAPLHSDRATPESEWMAVIDRSRYADQPRWAPSGELLFFISVRDGSNCIWGQRLDAVTKRPIGDAVAVYHAHDRQHQLLGMASSHDRIVMTRSELTSSIWVAEPK